MAYHISAGILEKETIHYKLTKWAAITTTIILVICFISRLSHSNWERNECLYIKISKYFASNETNMSNFHQVEVVGRDKNKTA